MSVYLSTGQKLAFPSPAILITYGKIQPFFLMFEHSQPLKSKMVLLGAVILATQ
jgi:hypothetical protein